MGGTGLLELGRYSTCLLEPQTSVPQSAVPLFHGLSFYNSPVRIVVGMSLGC